MKIYGLTGTAIRSYPGAVFVAECEAGHAVLSFPEPGEWYPVPADDVQFTERQGQRIFQIPFTITYLHVRSAYRGQGIGQKLVKRLQDYARKTGYGISIRVHPYGKGKPPTMAQLISFYRLCGFVDAGTHRKNVYMMWSPT